MPDPKLFDTDGPTEDVNIDDFDDVYNKMLEVDGLEFGFNIAVSDKRPDRTMSVEAMKSLRTNMIAWVGSRLQRKFKATGLGAKNIQVHITVSLDGETPRYQTDVPYIAWEDIADSEHITKGKQ